MRYIPPEISPLLVASGNTNLLQSTSLQRKRSHQHRAATGVQLHVKSGLAGHDTVKQSQIRTMAAVTPNWKGGVSMFHTQLTCQLVCVLFTDSKKQDRVLLSGARFIYKIFEWIWIKFGILIMFFWLNHHVDWFVEANVSEKNAVSIFRTEVIFSPEEGNRTFLRNVGIYQPIHTAI
jgi:hypothetical protein